MQSRKRIGILTSGGDCAGLNAVIRAVVHRAMGTYDWEVVGICRATQGLMCRPPEVFSFNLSNTRNLLMAGGHNLGTTNKGNRSTFTMFDGPLS